MGNLNSKLFYEYWKNKVYGWYREGELIILAICENGLTWDILDHSSNYVPRPPCGDLDKYVILHSSLCRKRATTYNPCRLLNRHIFLKTRKSIFNGLLWWITGISISPTVVTVEVITHKSGELWEVLERKLPPFGHPQSGIIR